jgi:hypothetical protein
MKNSISNKIDAYLDAVGGVEGDLTGDEIQALAEQWAESFECGRIAQVRAGDWMNQADVGGLGTHDPRKVDSVRPAQDGTNAVVVTTTRGESFRAFPDEEVWIAR